MQSYHTQLRVPANGVLVLHKIPFNEGEEVTVTIEPTDLAESHKRTFPYRGMPFHYQDPFLPVFDQKEWDVLK